MYIPFTSAQVQEALNSLLAYALPWLGLVLPGYLKRDGLGARGNALVSGFIIIVVASAQAYGAGKLGLNPVADFLAVSGGLAALLNGPLKPLDQWLQSNAGIGVHDTKLNVPAVTPPPPFTPTPAQVQAASSLSTSGQPYLATMQVPVPGGNAQQQPQQPQPQTQSSAQQAGQGHPWV